MEGNLGSVNTHACSVPVCVLKRRFAAAAVPTRQSCLWEAGPAPGEQDGATALAVSFNFHTGIRQRGGSVDLRTRHSRTLLIFSFLSAFSVFFTELNVRESDVRVCDESSCKYGGVCKEEGDGVKCACQFQVRAAHLFVCHFWPIC